MLRPSPPPTHPTRPPQPPSFQALQHEAEARSQVACADVEVVVQQQELLAGELEKLVYQLQTCGLQQVR